MAIITAMEREARAVQGHLQEASRFPMAGLRATMGRLGHTPVVVLVSGVGKEPSLKAVRALVREVRLSAVMSMGFAGALAEGLNTGDLLVYRRVFVASGESFQWLDSDPVLSEAARKAALAAGLALKEVDGATTLAPVMSGEEKRRLRQATSAAGTDMESYWVALAARECGIPFLAVRSVIDTAGQNLPPPVHRLASMGPVKQALVAPLMALLQPWAIPGLVRLGVQSGKAQRGLALLARALASLPATEGASTVR